MKFFLFVCLSFLLVTAKAKDGNDESEPKNHTKIGYATFYAKRFEGRRTTSGERYRAAKHTAAHLWLPFGTKVKVRNLATGKSVLVKINDRGPHSRKAMIDLSRSAARKIGFNRNGYAKVEISYELP